MKVKDLIAQLEVLNPNAEVMVIAETGEDNGYQTVFDCEEEFADLVTIGCGYPVTTKEKLQKAIRDNDKAVLAEFVADDIGQGNGYKSTKDWDRMLPDEVIYIPECGYAKKDKGEYSGYVQNENCIYTKQDFIDIVKNKVKPSRVDDEAFALFDMVDWQSPELLADELNYDADYEED